MKLFYKQNRPAPKLGQAGHVFSENLLHRGGQDLLQTGEAGQTVDPGSLGVALDQGEDIVDELLVDAVARLIDPLAGDLLLEVGHDVQGLQNGLTAVAVLAAGAAEGHHLIGKALHGGLDRGGAGQQSLLRVGLRVQMGTAALEEGEPSVAEVLASETKVPSA